MKHQHYYKNVKHLETIDVYRVLDLFAVTDPALAHAAKKILCAGGRGVKDQAKDVQEAIDSLLRWQEMQRENIIGMTAQEAIEFEDKELPSSGIYANDTGYTEQDQQAAALVHDAEPCSNTTIHADKDGWIPHYGKDCPLKDGDQFVQVKAGIEILGKARPAKEWNWRETKEDGGITHWRYAN